MQAEGTPDDLLKRFDQPDLEELFFDLVESADAAELAAGSAVARPDIEDTAETASRPLEPEDRDNLDALVEPADDLPPRGPGPASRPAHAVHDLRVADPARTRCSGAGVLQFAAALQEQPRRSCVVGAEHLPEEPAAAQRERRRLQPETCSTAPAEAGRLLVRLKPDTGDWGEPAYREQAVRNGDAAAVMVIPADLPEQFRNKNDVAVADPLQERRRAQPDHLSAASGGPRPLEAADRRGSPSRTTSCRQATCRPIEVKALDAATAQEVGGNVWGRIFPFLLVMMSLTGAFYPAVDLCAGEKERGTMETLLISPASRAEIVVGKFLTRPAGQRGDRPC